MVCRYDQLPLVHGDRKDDLMRIRTDQSLLMTHLAASYFPLLTLMIMKMISINCAVDHKMLLYWPNLKMLTSAVGRLASWHRGNSRLQSARINWTGYDKKVPLKKIFSAHIFQYTSKEEWMVWLIASHLSKPANCAGGPARSFQWIPISIKAKAGLDILAMCWLSCQEHKRVMCRRGSLVTNIKSKNLNSWSPTENQLWLVWINWSFPLIYGKTVRFLFLI